MSDNTSSAPPAAGSAPGAPLTPASPAGPGEDNRISRYGWHAIVLMSSAQMMSLLDRQILSILANDIRTDLGIGDAEMGLLYGTVFALFYALFSLPLGRLVDGWVRTKLLAICLAAWSFFAGLAAFAQGFTLLAISRIGVGIGEGATQPAANSILFDSLPKSRRGIAMGGLGVLLAARMGYIAIAENERYELESESNRVNLSLIPPRRGWILDRNGAPLASNQADFRVDIIPERLQDGERELQTLATLLELDDAKMRDLRKKIDAGREPLLHTVRGVGYMLRSPR